MVMGQIRRMDMTGIDYINTVIKQQKNAQKLKILENYDGNLSSPPTFLGYVDAYGEWKDNPSIAQELFLHTKSYHDFIRKSSLILLGRTGTGKTAILQCLNESVNSKQETTYKRSIYISFDPLLSKLKMATENIGNNKDSLTELCEVLELYIYISVMKDVCSNSDFDNKQKSKIKQYLNDTGADKQDFIEFVSNSLDKLKPSEQSIATELAFFLKDLAMSIRSKLKNTSYEEAKNELDLLLKKYDYDYLVLIDNADNYPLKEASVIVTIKSLIKVCFSHYNEASENHINVKVSIPSEVYTSVFNELPGKRQGNTVVIQWTNNELKRMIALRLVHLYSLCRVGKSMSGFELPTHRRIFACFESILDKNLYYENNPNSVSNAKRLLDLFLPERTPTSLSFALDTFGYILHHTLKKPREVILLFNKIIDIIDSENSINYFIDNPDKIRNVVHGSQEMLISSALSMYTDTYEGITEVCREVLCNSVFCFTEATLDNRLKSKIYNKSYDRDDVKRILLESGLVGEITNVHISDNNIYHIKAKFEYQIKGKLSFAKTMGYVLHPMCYEYYLCQIHEDALVLPNSLDSNDEIINSIIRKNF